MEDALQLAALGAVSNLLRRGGSGPSSASQRQAGGSTNSGGSKYSAARSFSEGLTDTVDGSSSHCLSAATGSRQPDGGFDALWKDESIRRAAARGGRSEVARHPQRAEVLKLAAQASSQLSLSELTSIVTDLDDDPIIQLPTIHDVELPPARFNLAAGNPPVLKEDTEGKPPVSSHKVTTAEGSSLSGLPRQSDEDEDLQALQHALAVAMSRLKPVDDTLRRLLMTPEVPVEYRHMAQHVRECVGLLS